VSQEGRSQFAAQVLAYTMLIGFVLFILHILFVCAAIIWAILRPSLYSHLALFLSLLPELGFFMLLVLEIIRPSSKRKPGLHERAIPTSEHTDGPLS